MYERRKCHGLHVEAPRGQQSLSHAPHPSTSNLDIDIPLKLIEAASNLQYLYSMNVTHKNFNPVRTGSSFN